MSPQVFGVNLRVAALICMTIIIIINFFCINIICRLREKVAAPKVDEIIARRYVGKRVLCRYDGEIDGGDDDDHAINEECVASDTRGLGFREIAAATGGLSIENVIGSGEFGVVYRGFMDGAPVAVKNLFSNRREVEEFCSLAEAMLLIRHKNLLKLLGYCAEGSYRVLVHEYVDNGNLEQWLHNGISKVSPLTWTIRMHIIKGIAQGLAYLHEEIKPPVIHFNLKSSNILVDHLWNPKISNIGTIKFLGPEYNRTHVGDKKSDIYDFGVLVMEIVSGRTPTQTYQNEIEEHLSDWIRYMVAEKNFGLILDPSLPRPPTVKQVQRILLIAIKCVDFKAERRPQMREIVNMLDLYEL